MAKKKSKIDKETRRFIEKVSDLIKKRRDDKYVLKGRKKEIREIKKTCLHWEIRKRNKDIPAVRPHPTKEGYWECRICREVFPVGPLDPGDEEQGIPHEVDLICDKFLGMVNHIVLLAVRMGGDSDDIAKFIKVKRLVPDVAKMSKNICKKLNKRQKYEDNRRNNSAGGRFDSWRYS